MTPCKYTSASLGTDTLLAEPPPAIAGSMHAEGLRGRAATLIARLARRLPVYPKVQKQANALITGLGGGARFCGAYHLNLSVFLSDDGLTTDLH